MWVMRSYTAWLEFMEDLVSHPSGVFPRQRIQEQLAATFDTQVAWNWEDADGSFGLINSCRLPGWPTAGDLELMVSTARRLHPLLHWYRTTGDPRPMSIGSVPVSLVPCGGREVLRDLMGPHGADEQLSIPYQLGPGYRAFVLCKTGADFGAEAIELSRLIAPLLALLWEQTAAIQRTAAPDVAAAWELTGRELTVLRLLGEGFTAVAIAHRLGVSPRTVHCHLAHLYRKLGVTDRMRAVLLANAAGLLGERSAPPNRVVGLPDRALAATPANGALILGRQTHFEPGHPIVTVGPPAEPALAVTRQRPTRTRETSSPVSSS